MRENPKQYSTLSIKSFVAVLLWQQCLQNNIKAFFLNFFLFKKYIVLKERKGLSEVLVLRTQLQDWSWASGYCIWP